LCNADMVSHGKSFDLLFLPIIADGKDDLIVAWDGEGVIREVFNILPLF
jgi:hypothetical protein